MRFALLVVLALTATATAEPDDRLALSVNSPISWATRQNVAVSGYARLSGHQAVRLNVASYAYDANLVGQVAIGVLDGGDLDGMRRGRLLDLGAGWMYFPRRTFDGLMLELGVFHRAGAISDEDVDRVHRDTQLGAARALVGWSWLIHDRAMISLAVGAAHGYEHGIETIERDAYPVDMMETHEVSRWSTTVEGYVRLGFTFGR